MDLIQRFQWLFVGILLILALMLVLCLIRAIVGPRIADRLVSVNMMGTIVMVIIATLAVIMKEGYLVDICLIYAMISFLAVVVFFAAAFFAGLPSTAFSVTSSKYVFPFTTFDSLSFIPVPFSK